jgi:hypothetical protein
MGLDYKTVNSYLDYLVGAFLLRRLLPYQANTHKRLVKSPKLFWRDSGLLHSLFGIPDRTTLLSQPWVGASWEGFVIEQALATLSATGRHCDAYYFRTSDQYEVDLLLDLGTELWAVEIKLSSSPSAADFQRLNHAADLIKAKRRFLISTTRHTSGEGDRVSCNLGSFLKYLTDLGT